MSIEAVAVKCAAFELMNQSSAESPGTGLHALLYTTNAVAQMHVKW